MHNYYGNSQKCHSNDRDCRNESKTRRVVIALIFWFFITCALCLLGGCLCYHVRKVYQQYREDEREEKEREENEGKNKSKMTFDEEFWYKREQAQLKDKQRKEKRENDKSVDLTNTTQLKTIEHTDAYSTISPMNEQSKLTMNSSTKEDILQQRSIVSKTSN